MKAYLHPLLDYRNLMILDSSYEVRTFHIISEEIISLHCDQASDLVIEKPLHDVGATQAHDGIENLRHDNAPDLLIPDFVIRSRSANKRPVAIVETMGSSSRDYRARKERTIPAMSLALGGAPVVPHDYVYPDGSIQDERDESFRNELRRVLRGR